MAYHNIIQLPMLEDVSDMDFFELAHLVHQIDTLSRLGVPGVSPSSSVATVANRIFTRMTTAMDSYFGAGNYRFYGSGERNKPSVCIDGGISGMQNFDNFVRIELRMTSYALRFSGSTQVELIQTE